MAVCQVCGSIFDNLEGFCPECGSEYQGDSGDRSAVDLFLEAEQRIQAGQISDARGLLTQAIKKEPDEGKYHFFLGSVLYKLGDFHAAYSTWQKADGLLPDNPRIHKCLVAARKRMAEQEA